MLLYSIPTTIRFLSHDSSLNSTLPCWDFCSILTLPHSWCTYVYLSTMFSNICLNTNYLFLCCIIQLHKNNTSCIYDIIFFENLVLLILLASSFKYTQNMSWSVAVITSDMCHRRSKGNFFKTYTNSQFHSDLVRCTKARSKQSQSIICTTMPTETTHW
jgi:hypothetical protein